MNIGMNINQSFTKKSWNKEDDAAAQNVLGLLLTMLKFDLDSPAFTVVLMMRLQVFVAMEELEGSELAQYVEQINNPETLASLDGKHDAETVEKMLNALDAYLTLHREEAALPLGTIDGLAQQAMDKLSDYATVHGFWLNWFEGGTPQEHTPPANHWRKGNTSATWKRLFEVRQ